MKINLIEKLFQKNEHQNNKPKVITFKISKNRIIKAKHAMQKTLGNIDLLNSFPELILGVGRVAIEGLIRGATVISIKNNKMGRIITPSNYDDYAFTNFIKIDGCVPTEESIYNELKLYFERRNEYRKNTSILAARIENDFGISKTTNRIIEVYSSTLKSRGLPNSK